MINNRQYSVRPACSSPKFSSWAWKVNFFEVVSFSMVLAIQICQLVFKKIAEDEIGSYVMTFFISLIAEVSSLAMLFTDRVGICEDSFWVRIPEIIWVEWMIYVPLLYYVALATDTKLKLSQTDKIIIILVTIAFILALCFQFTNSFVLSVLLLAFSTICYTVGTILFYFVTICNNEYFLRTTCITTVRNEYERHIKISQIRLALSILIMLPLYPFICFLSFVRIINYDMAYVMIALLNVTVNLIFTSVANIAHHNITNERIRLSLVAESLALAKATTANESRRVFVRYIMHEVRVPLSSLTMGLGYLQQLPINDDETNDILQMMEGATGFMKQTLNDVLDMDKIEEGKLELNFHPFSIAKMIQHGKATLQGIMKEKHINLIVKIHSGVPDMVIGDGFRLEHVIVNLVSNALKFSPEQSEVIISIDLAPDDYYLDIKSNAYDASMNHDNAICSMVPNPGSQRFGFLSNSLKKVSSGSTLNKIHIAPPNTAISSATNKAAGSPPNSITILFSVIDNGPGISESDLKTLFFPFSQIRPHELQSGGGSGVGLVICKQIVELHGGSISCQSTLGIGSIFTFSIPFDIASVDGVVDGLLAIDTGGVSGKSTVKLFDDMMSSNGSVYDDSISSEDNDEGKWDRPAYNKINERTSFNHLTQTVDVSGWTFMQSKKRNGALANMSNNRSTSNFINLLHENHDGKSLDNDGNIINTSTSYLTNNEFMNNRDEKQLEENSILISSNSNINTRNDIAISISSNRHQIYDHDTTSFINNNHINYDSQSNSIKLLYESEKHQLQTLQTTKKFNHSITGDADHEAKRDVNNNRWLPAGGVTKKHHVGHVLLVDDVTSNRRILSLFLQQRGIASTMAINGLEGVTAVMTGNQAFDLIFMDNLMPIMSGIEATKRLRSSGYPNLIIGLTGNALEEDIAEFISAGADSAIIKPVTVLQIDKILEYVETYGNTHVTNHKIVFTETHSYAVCL